jgi:hypothetical protein
LYLLLKIYVWLEEFLFLVDIKDLNSEIV